MSVIIFDIIYQKKSDNESIKLHPDSELQQLKLMICGKYKIYDLDNLFIYYKSKLISQPDTTKIKDIFKMKRCKIEVRKTKIKPKEPSKYQCHYCKMPAGFICDKCSEILCSCCVKKKVHLNHQNKIIKLDEYKNYIKKSLKDYANELDEKILNDEDYRFFQFWNYDMTKETGNVNSTIEFLKSELEDIKQMQIDSIISLGENNNFEDIKKQIENVIQQYGEIDTEGEFETIFDEKKKLFQSSKNVLDNYNELKNKLLIYTKVVKDIQVFNQGLVNSIKEKFSIMKKRFGKLATNNLLVNVGGIKNENDNNINHNNNDNIDNNINNNINNNDNSFNLSGNKNNKSINNNHKDDTHSINRNQIDYNSKNSSAKNQSNNQNKKSNKSNNNEDNEKYVEPNSEILVKPFADDENKSKGSEKINKTMLLNNKIQSNSPLNNTNVNNANNKVNIVPKISNEEKSDRHLFKLKDERKILIFSLNNQNFKEKIFKDNTTSFKKELTTEVDVTQLNVDEKLFILSGKNFNKFYFYDYNSNTINFLGTTLFSHFYGVMVYCPINKSIYLIGGNNQTRSEVYRIGDVDSKRENAWKIAPSLNESRQEFAAMYMNGYIYVFFGFSPKKRVNLSSIERLKIDNEILDSIDLNSGSNQNNIQEQQYNQYNYNENLNTNKFEIVYVNEQITLSSLSCAKFVDEDSDDEDCILLLGGFDGKNYVDSSLLLNTKEMKIRDCDIVIPNMSKHYQFLFQKESAFVEVEPDVQLIFDMKNNVHRLSRESYELFSVVQ